MAEDENPKPDPFLTVSAAITQMATSVQDLGTSLGKKLDTLVSLQSNTAVIKQPQSGSSTDLDQMDCEVLLDQFTCPSTSEGAQSDNPSAADCIFHDLSQDLEVEGTGSPVPEDIATLITTLLSSGLPEDKLKDKLNAYLTPANIPLLCKVKVNQVIWDSLDTTARSSDLKLQKVQGLITKALMAGISAAAKLKAAGVQQEDLLQSLRHTTDSIVFLAMASREINFKRRDFLKPHIHADYVPLCSTSVPITEELFGDDLSQRMKDIKELKVTKQALQPPFKRPFLGRKPVTPYPSRALRTQFQHRRGKGRGFPQYRKKGYPAKNL
ncbi:uncharacterized protein LOC106150815 [Lingula anatina]|uniref:Uncharacterized protein LOC106150815 n=1 Tax=Lingula anatina TaxID=7574 RepID=A0A1S3H1B4_LINAN|nr:uncharacterized protein LOC106150815 [Lingula anatina]|eukprot:XP_013379271.1 uncharacterized protein LOC106150815 [Lingula anatina]